MKWNAFDLVSPAINKTGERILPFQFWDWLKLTIISGLAANRRGFNGGSGGNSKVENGENSGTGANLEEAKTQIRNFIKDYWIFGALIFSVIFAIITILSYVSSVFSFIYIESLKTNERFKKKKGFTLSIVLLLIALIAIIAIFTYIGYFSIKENVMPPVSKILLNSSVFLLLIAIIFVWLFKIFGLIKPFKKNNSKGVSLFLFKFVITIITLLVVAGLAFPYVYSFMAGNPVIKTVGIPYIIFSIIALVAYIIVLVIIFLFLYDFAVPYTYVKGTTIRFSLSQIWKNIKENPLEVFVYWLARLVLSLAVAIIAILIAIIVFIIFALIGLLIFCIGFLLFKIIGGVDIFIILAISAGIMLFIIFLIVVGMCILPFTVFLKYFELLNFEQLTGLKLFKPNKKPKKNKR